MTEDKIYSGWDKIPKGHASKKVVPGCLVIEGGAFRGLYNQGVLDAFMENDINIQTVVGVSAGALAGMNYVSGQIGRSARVNLKYRHDPRYIGVKAYSVSKSPLNINFLLKYYNRHEPLDKKCFFSQKRNFIAVATSCRDGKPRYYNKYNCTSVLKAVKASASMPYMSPMVYIDGEPCLDGGCSCKIAYQYALDNDFEKIVIIRTREREFRKPDKVSNAALKVYRKWPAFAQSLAHSNIDYNKQCDEVLELEKSGRAFVIAPKEKVTVGRLEKDMEKLGDLYWEGYNEALECMDELKSYLGITE